MRVRGATTADAEAMARVHTESSDAAYAHIGSAEPGAYERRLAVWREILAQEHSAFVAEDGGRALPQKAPAASSEQALEPGSRDSSDASRSTTRRKRTRHLRAYAGPMWTWIVLGVLYVLVVLGYRILGGVGAAADALRDWGRASSRGAHAPHTSS